ncbi:3-ketoacyl-CoA thiolase [Candidatus Rubidus massiliensis]|nr:MAG: acetyl-CoA acyltransferase [Chlamydia sp. 32-24]CDZ81772.1 3-ketoacyl-CoA thiolase [Candidatus Rubidus massiliensis]
MKERVAIIEGVRTPYCKSNGALKDIYADDLGAVAVQALLAKTGIRGEEVDELIFGNVLQPPDKTNIARVLSVKSGLPISVPSYTVNRNCASGIEAIASGVDRILQGNAQVIIAGGTESMSHFPVLFPNAMRDFLLALQKAKNFKQKIQVLLKFRPSYLYPEMPGISDPLCSLTMGQTAEILAREFKITRKEQDEFAFQSQKRAVEAIKSGKLAEEIIPVFLPPNYANAQLVDEGPRDNQTMDALAKLKPAFDKYTGTVTAGNASPTTDGAAALLLMTETKAKELGLKPLGYIVDYAEAGLQPNKMGLGPVYATSKLLKKTGKELKDFDLIEINEAFAAQVLAVKKAFASDEFAKKELGRDKAIGEIDNDKLNVNGGAIALGHPLGASGVRLVLTLLKELRRRNKNLGLATLCVGGGQGQAMIVEVAND